MTRNGFYKNRIKKLRAGGFDRKEIGKIMNSLYDIKPVRIKRLMNADNNKLFKKVDGKSISD